MQYAFGVFCFATNIYNGNQLVWAKSSANTYTYDANGNMVYDGLRGMNTTYNRLNLPLTISKGNDVLTYGYLADGQKCEKTFSNKVTHYRSTMVFDDSGNPDYVLHPEGMAVHTGSNEWQWHFNLTDYLGNTRAVLDENGNVLQQTDYYPFGTAFVLDNTAKNKYLYGGKELQSESLGGTQLGLYDFEARFYNPNLGSWPTRDPFSERYYRTSPYVYCLNNPIKYVDQDGRDVLIWYKNDAGKMSSYRYTGEKVSHSNTYVNKVVNAINYNIDNGGGDPSKAATTNKDITINVYETSGFQHHSNGTVYWNPELGSQYENGVVVSPATILDHELDHGVQYATNPDQHGEDSKKGSDKQYDTKEERRVITGSEQKTARANGETKQGQVTRTNHKGKSVITESETSTKINKTKTDEYREKQAELQRKAHSSEW